MAEPGKKPRAVLAKETRQRKVHCPVHARSFHFNDDMRLVGQFSGHTHRHVLEQVKEMLAMMNEGVRDVTDKLGFARRTEAPAMFPWFIARACAFVQRARNKGAGSRARFASDASAVSHSVWHAPRPSMSCASHALETLRADRVQVPQTPKRREYWSCPAEGSWQRVRE